MDGTAGSYATFAARPASTVVELDGNAYRKTVLADLLVTGVTLDDPFALVGFAADEPAADDTGALRARLADVVGFWQREANSPRYKGIAGELLRQRARLEEVLLDPINRRQARERLAAAQHQAAGARRDRVAQLAGAVVQRHGGIPRSRLVLLQRLADRDGLTAEDLADLLGTHRVIEDGGGVAPLDASVRRMIRAALDQLRVKGEKERSASLWAYLGIATDAEDEALAAAYESLAAGNQKRAYDRDKTIHADVLALAKEHLLSPGPRARALAALLIDARELVMDRVLETALVDAELFPPDVDRLVSGLLAEGLGLTEAQARSVVREAATASGISVTTGTASAVCASCGARQGQPPRATAVAPPAGVGAPAAATRPAVPASSAFADAGRSSPLAAKAGGPGGPGATSSMGPASTAAAGKGTPEDEWRQLEREVTMRRVVAASARAARLVRSAPGIAGPGGQLPGQRQAELLRTLETARATVRQALTVADPAERERAVYAVLDVVGDLAEAQEALASLPLEPPSDVTVDVAAGEATLRWQPSHASRTVTYTVVRVTMGPDGERVDHRVGSTTATTLTDGGLPGAGIVGWEVVAGSAGRRSVPAMTEPRPLLPDVTRLRAATGTAGITLSWEDQAGTDPHAGIVVERTVLSPHEGPMRRTRVKGRRWTDPDVRTGLSYRYVVRVETVVGGVSARTPGCTVEVSLVAQPVPVLDLAPEACDEGVRLAWTTDATSAVVVYASDVALGPVGEDLDLSVFDRAARRVDGATGPGSAVDQPRGAVTIYTPVTTHGDRGLLGQSVRWVDIAPVSDLVAEDSGRVITLRWGFPRGVSEVQVGWRRDRPPASLGDVETSMRVHADEVRAAGWQTAAPDDGQPWHLLVVPVVQLPGELATGPASSVSVRG